MGNAELDYLSDVLGIRSVMFTHDVPQSRLAVLVPRAPSDAERELLSKMLQAAGVRSHQIEVAAPTSAQLDGAGWEAIWAFGESVDQTASTKWGVPVLQLPDLADFVKNDDPEAVKQVKKSAWSQIQLFQKGLGR